MLVGTNKVGMPQKQNGHVQVVCTEYLSLNMPFSFYKGLLVIVEQWLAGIDPRHV